MQWVKHHSTQILFSVQIVYWKRGQCCTNLGKTVILVQNKAKVTDWSCKSAKHRLLEKLCHWKWNKEISLNCFCLCFSFILFVYNLIFWCGETLKTQCREYIWHVQKCRRSLKESVIILKNKWLRERGIKD